MAPPNGPSRGPELLIVGFFCPVVPFVMAYRVYTDAEGRGGDRAAFWALAAGSLTVLTDVGGILALVMYVWQRE